VAGWYRSHGYDFLVMTDHNSIQEHVPGDTLHAVLPAFSEYAPGFDVPGEFLLIRGEELSDEIDGKPLHVTVVNTPEVIRPRGGTTAAGALQRDLDAVREVAARRGVAVVAGVNHPNFYWAATAADLIGLRGLSLFEVYNGSVRVNNEGDATRPGVERMWDEVLAARVRAGAGAVWGTAVDDAHNFVRFDPAVTNPGRGWVMVRADSLTPNTIAEALARGDFYASTGVTLRGVGFDGERYQVRIHEEPGVEYTTNFIGTREGGEVGQLLEAVRGPTATYRLRGDDLYVRALVVSSRLKSNGYAPGERERAWAQPAIARPAGSGDDR
jgi:hypothetical protein